MRAKKTLVKISSWQASAKSHHQAQGNKNVNYQTLTPIRISHLLNDATHFLQWSTVPTGHRHSLPSHICPLVSEQWLSSLHGLNSPMTYLIICLFTGIYFNFYVVQGQTQGIVNRHAMLLYGQCTEMKTSHIESPSLQIMSHTIQQTYRNLLLLCHRFFCEYDCYYAMGGNNSKCLIHQSSVYASVIILGF